MGIVLSGVFLTNSVEKHDNMQIIKGLLLVESTIKIAGPLQSNQAELLNCFLIGATSSARLSSGLPSNLLLDECQQVGDVPHGLAVVLFDILE